MELPPYYPGAKCDHLCPDDGYYSHMSLYPEIKQVCSQCPKNMISVNGGFFVDARMDDENHLSFMLGQHFEIDCFETFWGRDGRSELRPGCKSWGATGRSFKTPQQIEPEKDSNETISEKVEYYLTYSDTFLYDGKVEFRYRANSKMIDGKLLNGLFKFTIDGVDQMATPTVQTSGIWSDVSREVTAGFHKLQWSF
jgi:hypothetical protein